jgi:transposase
MTFAPQFKAFLKDARAVGRRRPDLADSAIGAHRRRLDRELDRLLDLKPTDVEGSHLRATVAVTASDRLPVFLTRRDVGATNNNSERALRPSVIFRRVTNGFRSQWGANVYADLCSVVATGRLAGRTALAVDLNSILNDGSFGPHDGSWLRDDVAATMAINLDLCWRAVNF